MENYKILKETNFSRLKEIIKKEKEKPIIFNSDDDELNLKILEKLPIQILLINLENRKDFQKQRNSGFNQVMARLAKKNSIKIGINLDELINSKNKEKIIARLRQKIELCKKNKLKMVFVSEKENKKFQNLISLSLSLGMPTWMIEEI